MAIHKTVGVRLKNVNFQWVESFIEDLNMQFNKVQLVCSTVQMSYSRQGPPNKGVF